MSAVDGSPVSTGSERVLVRALWPGPGGPRRYCGWGKQMIGPVRRPRHYVLVAGMAVAVALGPSWRVHAAGIAPGLVANRHLIGVTVSARFAGTGGGRAGCRAAPAVAPGYGYGQYLSQRGVDHLRRRPAGAQLAAGAWSQAWRAGDQSRPEQSTATPVRGLRGAMAGPGISCPSVSRWPEAGFRDMSFTYPVGAARADIQTLACREQAAGEPARPPHGGCMAEGIAERIQRLYTVPAAPEQGGIFRALGTGPGSGAGEVRGQLRGIFGGDPALAYVMFGANERDAGVTIPARACGAAGGSGGQLSCGDRASLPGRSTRYRIVWLVCAQCGTRVAWLFYDERDIPLCVSPLHGRLELQQ
jgi:hypothetical protein